MTNFKVTGTDICVTTTKALILIPKWHVYEMYVRHWIMSKKTVV